MERKKITDFEQLDEKDPFAELDEKDPFAELDGKDITESNELEQTIQEDYDALDVDAQKTRTFLTDKKEIAFILDKMGVKNYQIDEQGVINVKGNVYLDSMLWIKNGLMKYSHFPRIPFKFGVVEGDFSVSGCNYNTMEGFPNKIGGNFYADRNKFKNTKHFPAYVGLNIDVSHCEIEIVEDMPYTANGIVNLSHNMIHDASGLSKKIYGSLNLSKNFLNNTDWMPDYIGYHLDFSFNQVVNITKNIAKVKDFIARGNNLESMIGLPITMDNCDIRDNRISNDFDVYSDIAFGFYADDGVIKPKTTQMKTKNPFSSGFKG